MQIKNWDHNELPRFCLVRRFPDAAYHALQHISSSMVRTAKRASIRHMLAGSESTPAMLIGSVVHELVLQPDRVTYSPLLPEVPKPEGMDMRRKEWKDWAASPEGLEWADAVASTQAENDARRASGRVVSDHVWQRACTMRDAIMGHEYAGMLIGDGAELELTGVSEIDGVPVRARWDIFNPKWSAMADIKKTQDASPEGFAKSVANYGYHVQAAWYRRVWVSLGHEVDSFRWIWIAVEDSPTADIAIYQASPEMLEAGDLEIDDIWPSIVSWFHAGASFKDAPGYPVFPQTLELPRWAQRRRAPVVEDRPELPSMFARTSDFIQQDDEGLPWEF